MGWLDEVGKILMYPGAMISGSFEQLIRRSAGATIHIAGGNVFYAVGDLRELGIDAFYPVELAGDMADLHVRKKDKKRAMRMLRSWGYECW